MGEAARSASILSRIFRNSDPEEWMNTWMRGSIVSRPVMPVLSDEAMSRESIYPDIE